MTDVLVEFCLKPDDALLDLLRHEQRGEQKLYHFVRRAIRFRAVDFLEDRRYTSIDFEAHSFHLAAPDDDDQPDDMPNEVREAEARFRDDSFITPFTTSATQIALSKVGFAGCIEKSSGRKYLHVCYRAEIQIGGKKTKVIKNVSRGALITAMIQMQTQVATHGPKQ